MLIFLLLVCISLGGSLAADDSLNCNPSKCKSLLPDLDPTDIDDVLPSADRLLHMCPEIQLWITCLSNEISACLNADLTDLLSSDNETIAKNVNIFLGASEVFNELCDENTRIHKAYAENIECMRSVVIDPVVGLLCTFEAQSLYGAYKSVNGIEEETKPVGCMVVAHMVACVSNEMKEKCGETARATLLEMIKRIKMLKYGLCTSNDLAELKTTYIEFLQLEEDKHSIYAEAFDLKKRK